MVEPGRRRLGDRYELDRLLATGGMGQVWRAVDTALHRPVAVKVLRSEYTSDATFLARFRAEAQHAASLNHPNTAAVFDYGEATAEDGSGETLAYLVMELVEGEPLSTLLAREGRLDTGTTLSIMRQTAFALAEAHRVGLVHRDVKPGNVMVRPDGEVKITDFGIAWSARSVALTQTGQLIGTPQYLSPEAAEGRAVTPASDVYALGLIGYECLAGAPAFAGDNAVTLALKQVQQDPEPLPDDLSGEVRDLIGRAVAKDPAARFADGAVFVEAIEDVMAGRPLPDPAGTVAVAVARPAPLQTGDPAPIPAQRRKDREPSDPGTTAWAPRATARHRSPITMAMLSLIGLLVGAGVAAAVIASSADGPTGTATAAELQGRGSVLLSAEDYVGRRLSEVTDRLSGMGLTVEPRAEARDDVVPDLVTGIDPAGRSLMAGDTVLVTYAVSTGSGAGDGGAMVTGAVVGDPGPAAPTQDEQEPAGTEPADQPAAPTTGEGAGAGQTTGSAAGEPTGSEPTTPGAPTPDPESPAPTTPAPTTPDPSPPGPTNPGPTTSGPTTPAPTTPGGSGDGSADPGSAETAP